MRDAIYLDFPLEEYQGRLRRAQEAMRKGNLDGLLLTMRENVEYLSGFTAVSWRLAEKAFWLVVPREGEPKLTVDSTHELNAERTSWLEDIRIWGKKGKSSIDYLVDMFHDLRLTRATVGVELSTNFIGMSIEDFQEIQRRLPEVKFVDAVSLLGRLRTLKSSLEVERVRKACEISCQGFELALRSAQAGMTERDLLNLIVGEWLRLGADSPYYANNHSFLSLVANRIGQVSASPVDRQIENGDLIHIDGGAAYRGYCADFERNVVVGGNPPKELQAAIDACSEVIDRTLASIKPGVTSAEIWHVAEQAVTDAGYKGKYRRLMMDKISLRAGALIGHAIGFTFHERPLIVPTDDTVWVEGMTGAVEFSLGDPRYGRPDLEDNFVVTEDGCEILTPLPRGLIW